MKRIEKFDKSKICLNVDKPCPLNCTSNKYVDGGLVEYNGIYEFHCPHCNVNWIEVYENDWQHLFIKWGGILVSKQDYIIKNAVTILKNKAIELLCELKVESFKDKTAEELFNLIIDDATIKYVEQKLNIILPNHRIKEHLLRKFSEWHNNYLTYGNLFDVNHFSPNGSACCALCKHSVFEDLSNKYCRLRLNDNVSPISSEKELQNKNCIEINLTIAERCKYYTLRENIE